MIFCVLLVALVSLATGSNLYLESPLSQQKKVPLLKAHPYSCELVYFKVHQCSLTAFITDAAAQTKLVRIMLFLNIESCNNISQQAPVSDGKAEFRFDFSDIAQLSQNSSVELNVEIVLEFDSDPKTAERRRSYLIFSKADNFYKVKLPVVAIVVTQLVGLLCILVLPLNVRYRKFLPFSFNICTSLLYIAVLVVALYLQMLFPSSDAVYYVQRIVVALFSLGCLFLYTQDLLYFATDKNKVVLATASIFAVAVIGCDELLPQMENAWFLNDVIAFMVAGAIIKFVIIRRLKTAIWAIAALWVFSWLRQFAIEFGLQEYDQGTGIRIVPLFLQIPKIWLDSQAAYSCSAFGSSKIISFGVILNFCKRVDLYLSTHFYRKLGWTLASVCVLAELGYNLLRQDLPTMEVMSVIIFYPLVTALILFFAEKRGEWAEIWHGSFFDMAVNRASIPREVSFDGMERSFGEDLLINKGSLENH